MEKSRVDGMMKGGDLESEESVDDVNDVVDMAEGVTDGVEAPGTGFSAVVDTASATRSGTVQFTNKEMQLMENACSHDSAMNAPMLVAWIFKNVEEEPTLVSGLKYLLMHLNTGEGCRIFQKHNACDTVIRAHHHYRTHVQVQQLCVSIFKQFLDCNLTRDELINNSVTLLRVVFNIAHLFMSSVSHVEAACRYAKCIIAAHI
jgi:hypothetical protein